MQPCGPRRVVFAEEEEDELPLVTEKVVLERHEAVRSSATDTCPPLISIIYDRMVDGAEESTEV